jgi:hypothetical protein
LSGLALYSNITIFSFKKYSTGTKCRFGNFFKPRELAQYFNDYETNVIL